MYKGRKFKLLALAAVAALLAGWLVFKPDDNRSPSPTTQTNQAATVQTGQSGQGNTEPRTSEQSLGTYIEKADYKYAVPSGWAEMSKEVIQRTEADSGIGRITDLAATFRIKIAPSTPSNDNELKNNTLNDVKRNAVNFTLVSTNSTKVDSKPGYVFVYTFTDTSSKQKFRHQLHAVPSKGKTFFLLASSVDSDFDKQGAEFQKILASFKFK